MALETWSRAFSITPYYSNDLAPLHLMSIKCPAQRETQHRTNFARKDISPLYGYKRPRGYELIRRGRSGGAGSALCQRHLPGQQLSTKNKYLEQSANCPFTLLQPWFLGENGFSRGKSRVPTQRPCGRKQRGCRGAPEGAALSLRIPALAGPGRSSSVQQAGNLGLTEPPQAGGPAGGQEMGRWPVGPRSARRRPMNIQCRRLPEEHLPINYWSCGGSPFSPPCRNACNPISPVPSATRPAPAPV